MNPAMIALTAGTSIISLLTGFSQYHEKEEQAKAKAALGDAASYNRGLQQYWQTSDFDNISGIHTSAPKPESGMLAEKLSTDLVNVGEGRASTSERGYITLANGERVGEGAELPINTSAIAQQAVGTAISTGLSLFSAVSQFNAAKK